MLWKIRELLVEASDLYDQTAERIPPAAPTFYGGARWMGDILSAVDGVKRDFPQRNWNALGMSKYGICLLIAIFPPPLLKIPIEYALFVTACLFYLIEAQLVFLFPLAIEEDASPWRTSWRFTRKAGGTLRVSLVTMYIAWTMLTGGLRGRGFRRSWCIGCIAVVLWYVRVKRS